MITVSKERKPGLVDTAMGTESGLVNVESFGGVIAQLWYLKLSGSGSCGRLALADGAGAEYP